MKLAMVAIGLGVLGGVAQAGPVARFGLTYGIRDQAAPDSVELGPAVALGERLGPVTGEIDYAYLSFFDPDASATGVHRLGLTLRADIYQVRPVTCDHFACTQGSALYAEIGAAARFGRWIQQYGLGPQTEPEGHLGVGIELDNRLRPYRYGWQLGLRFVVSKAGQQSVTPLSGVACRTTSPGGTCGGSPSPQVDAAVFVEWMYVIGA